MFKRIDHIEIIPLDTEKCLEFYTGILSFTIKERIPFNMPPIKELIFIELGDTVVEVISVDNPAPKPETQFSVGYRGIALEVDDMDKAVEYLRSKDVKISVEPMDIGDSFRAEITDPDGFMIELKQWK